MAVGDIQETQAPRYQDNQRWDEVDAQAEGQLRLLREQMYTKAFIGAGLAFLSGVGETIGLVLQGGSITGQSIGNSLVTLGAELFAAIDADGLLIIKSAASGAITVSCPVGTSTVYAYGIDTPTDMAQRAFIATVAPYDEFFNGTNTRFTNKGGLVAISGDATVNSAVINGVTRPLVAIALVTNAGGNTTIVKQYTNVLHAVRPLALPLTNDAPFNASIIGTVGSTAWSYAVVARGRKGQVLKVSPIVTLSSGAATLNTSGNNNQITFPPLPEAQDYLIYRTAAGGTPNTTGLITPTPIVLPPGYTSSVTFVDTGFVGDNSALPSSSPSPEVVPLSSTDRGAGGSTSLSINGMMRTLATLMADMKFKRGGLGTQPNPQLATSDYGLFSAVRRGLDPVDRSTNTVWTIGDGVNTFGDFDASNYASFDLLLADLFTLINAVAQVTLSNSRTVLNDKFTVLIKPGTQGAYTLAADVAVPSNIVLTAEQGALLTTTLTTVIGGFKINWNGRTVIQLSSHKLTLSDGSEAHHLFFLGGTGGQVVLNGHNIIDGCSFVQAYGTSVGSVDPVLVTTSSPPTGGVQEIKVRHTHFYTFNNMGTNLPNSAYAFSTGISFASARDVLIEDCEFINDMQYTSFGFGDTPVIPIFVTLTSMVGDVKMRRCDFTLCDQVSAIASPRQQPALRIVAPVGAEANKLISIEDCHFSFRNWRTGAVAAITVGSGFINYPAIEIDEEINVDINRCKFFTVSGGVLFLMSPVAGHTYNHLSTKIRNCTFDTVGTGVYITSASSGNPTVRGISILDNVYTNCFQALYYNGNGVKNFAIKDLIIARNKLIDFTVNGACGFQVVGLGVTNVNVSGNQGDNINDFFAIVQSLSTSALTNVSIVDNSIDTVLQAGATVNHVLAVLGAGATSGFARSVNVCRNRLSNVQPGITTPAGTEHPIMVTGGTLSDVKVDDNTISRAGINYTGGTRPYHIGIFAGTSTSGDIFENISVADNTLGDSISQLEAAIITKLAVGAAVLFSRNVSVVDNTFVTNYAAGTAAQGLSWNLGDGGVGDKWANTDFSHNKTTYDCGGAGVTLTNDSFELRLNINAGLNFIGNMFYINGTGAWQVGPPTKGALLIAGGGVSASMKAVGNTSTNSSGTATNFTFTGFGSGYSAGNT